VALGDGFTAITAGQLDHACECLQDALDDRNNPRAPATALLTLGWAQELRGESGPDTEQFAQWRLFNFKGTVVISRS
jgi:hypothetical protein